MGENLLYASYCGVSLSIRSREVVGVALPMDGDVGVPETPIFNLDTLGVLDDGDAAGVDEVGSVEELPC